MTSRVTFLPVAARLSVTILAVGLLLSQGCTTMFHNDRIISSQAPVVEKVLEDTRRAGHSVPESSMRHPATESFEEEFSREAATEDSLDLNCSWFYFLWGSQAEYDHRYEEALEFYQKSLICAPQTHYIERKLPLLMIEMERYDDADKWLTSRLEKAPDNRDWLELQGTVALEQNDPEKAAENFRRVLHIDPDDEQITSNLAVLYARLGELNRAELLLQSFVKKKRDAIAPRITLARILVEQKRFTDAAKQYDIILKQKWSNTIAFELASLYRISSKDDKAEAVFKQMLKHDSQDERAGINLARLYIDQQKYADAEQELDRLRRFSNNTSAIDYFRASLYLKQKRNEEAEKLLESLLETPRHNDAAWFLGLLQYQEKKKEEALATLKKVGSDSENFEESVYLQTRIYEELKEFNKAARNLKEYIADHEHSSPLFYTLISSLLQSQGKMREAKEYLEEGRKLYPDSVRLLYETGLLYKQQGIEAQAISSMEKILELDPDNAEALNFVGYSWADQGIKLDKAFEYVTRANELKPKNGFILDSLGWVLYKQGKLRKAADFLSRALHITPDNWLIMEHLGDVYNALQRPRDARKYYRNAWKACNDNKEKERLRAKINDLK
ncbi:tetratricopeptide repeat protein [Desulforhopalus vacuolatus]|uniref:tetratricopeptide repeat protein n=1 Tax=Desulforhopalus vacuolatus TaxID=40414 RepID=UPI00196297B6|nr:tetratricopeptide repeat protein [Desulforhopalus vacuolatus]MBM9519802.1 tetratricopeptide repeat protein [Desulforhopalus vacuolatus]